MTRKKKRELKKKKQNPEEIKALRLDSLLNLKKELFDPNEIAALIDKAKEEEAQTQKTSDKLTQSSVKNSFAEGLSLSEEDALKAQIFSCWSIPLGFLTIKIYLLELN